MNKAKLSKERSKYIKDIKKKKVLILVTQILLLVVFLCLLEFLANKNLIDSFITSKPSRIWTTLTNLGSNDLMKHIGVTVYESVVGFLAGTILGILIAIILWWSDFLSKVAEPYLVVLNSLPKVALRTNYYNLGRSGNSCYNSNGNCYFANSNNLRKFKWICKNR